MNESQSNQKMEMLFNVLKVLLVVFSIKLLYDDCNAPARKVIHVEDPKFSLLGPYNSTRYNKTNYNQLIDLKDFSFLLNPQPCENYNKGLLLVVIVSSKPDNYEKRKIIRETWGQTVDSMKVVFLVGESNNETITTNIINESLSFGDIVLGSFIDAYRNMTYKHVMGLKWVTHYCPKARYVLKTDDDVAVNVFELRRFLALELSPWGANKFIACSVFKKSLIERDKKSKWYVTPSEFAGVHYPVYCAGMAIIYSQDVVHDILTMAQSLPYFWIDDVHLTGVIASRLNIERNHLGSLILTHKRLNKLITRGREPVGKFLFGPQDLSTNKVLEIWKSILK